MQRTSITALATLAALASCVPDEGARPSLLTDDVVLAVRAEPPEAEPGAGVAFVLLAAGPDGALADPDARWSLCLEPKPATEAGTVSAACATGTLDPLGTGGAIDATLPDDACALHGPETPPGDFRPRDPDATGGYYLPVGVELGDRLAFAGERLHCGLANAPIDVIQDFRDRYVDNRNPAPPAIDAPAGARAGEAVDLVARWDATDAEDYVAYDTRARRLVTRREAMSVSWYATAGSFDADRTGRAEEDPATDTAGVWTAPDLAGPVSLFVVLRDSRGGVAWTELAIDVTR